MNLPSRPPLKYLFEEIPFSNLRTNCSTRPLSCWAQITQIDGSFRSNVRLVYGPYCFRPFSTQSASPLSLKMNTGFCICSHCPWMFGASSISMRVPSISGIFFDWMYFLSVSMRAFLFSPPLNDDTACECVRGARPSVYRAYEEDSRRSFRGSPPDIPP